MNKSITLDDIRAMAALCKENEIPPKQARNGEFYYELRYEGGKIAFVTPSADKIYDPITNEILDFT